ncbi:unnamed protein product [Boreogadus saida]
MNSERRASLEGRPPSPPSEEEEQQEEEEEEEEEEQLNHNKRSNAPRGAADRHLGRGETRGRAGGQEEEEEEPGLRGEKRYEEERDLHRLREARRPAAPPP